MATASCVGTGWRSHSHRLVLTKMLDPSIYTMCRLSLDVSIKVTLQEGVEMQQTNKRRALARRLQSGWLRHCSLLLAAMGPNQANSPGPTKPPQQRDDCDTDDGDENDDDESSEDPGLDASAGLEENDDDAGAEAPESPLPTVAGLPRDREDCRHRILPAGSSASGTASPRTHRQASTSRCRSTSRSVARV